MNIRIKKLNIYNHEEFIKLSHNIALFIFMSTGHQGSFDINYESSRNCNTEPTFDELMSRTNEYLKRKKQRSTSSSSIVEYIHGSFNDMMNGRPVNCPEVRKRITPDEAVLSGCEIRGTIRATYNESYGFIQSDSYTYSSHPTSSYSSCSLTDGYRTTGSCRPH
jgi:hypothetical protein